MSPPEVWGPAVWTLFHTLAEKINDDAYPFVSHSLFNMIVRICKFLPCPECSIDASNFLAKIKISDIKTKTEFKNTFYVFHNWVNAKKRKPIFNYSNISIYGRYNLIKIVNNFIANYQTKGNMKLLNESFQRKLIVTDFKNWFTRSIRAFMPRINIPVPIVEPVLVLELVLEPIVVIEEPIVEEPIVVEELVIKEEPIVVEEPIIIEEHIVVVEEPILVLEPIIIEEPIIVEEPIVVEEPVVEQEIAIPKKKNKKSKK